MKRFIGVLVSILATASVYAGFPASWTNPVEPFRIVGNVYYVGTEDLASYLITTSDGHILVDAPMEENVPLLLRSIRALGFDPADIEIMINTHAHFDHAGGFAAMKKLTGARLLVSEADGTLIERGGREDFALGDSALFPRTSVDGRLTDGQIVNLGGVELRAMVTPGHTMGGTSWVLEVDDGGEMRRVLIANSMSAPGYDLVGNEKYPKIMDDYRASFDRLEAVDADVFLSTHGSFFGLSRKRREMSAGGNPFVDPRESKRFVARWREIVEKQYVEQGGR